jgi:drug/metabolite transporter (DMT)-like permease
MLVLATLLWGVSFPLVKNWQDASGDCPGGDLLASLTLIVVRMGLALVLLALVRPGLLTRPTRREHAAGLLIGLAFGAGFVLQVWGLARTSPALSAFLTSLAGAWVPLLAYAFCRITAPRLTLLGLGVGMAGAAVLGIDLRQPWMLGGGEGLTVLASVLFAVQIVLLDRLGQHLRPAHFTAGLLGMTGGLALAGAVPLAAGGAGLVPWLEWTAGMLSHPAVLRDVLLLTVLSTLGAMHLMNVYQPYVPASRAGLIYLLEPVFASFFSLGMGHDPLTLRLVLGGGLILGGNLLVELPRWLRERRKGKAKTPADGRGL